MEFFRRTAAAPKIVMEPVAEARNPANHDQYLQEVLEPYDLKGCLAKVFVAQSQEGYEELVTKSAMSNELGFLNYFQGREEVDRWAKEFFPGQKAAGFPVIRRYIFERPTLYKNMGTYTKSILYGNQNHDWGDAYTSFGFVQERKGERLLDTITSLDEITPRAMLEKHIPFAVTLAFLESQGVMHGDIKPKQLIFDVNTQESTLVDFAAAQKKWGTDYMEPFRHPLPAGITFPGFTVDFAAPEQLRSFYNSEKYGMSPLEREMEMNMAIEFQEAFHTGLTMDDILDGDYEASTKVDVYALALSIAYSLEPMESATPSSITNLLQECWQKDSSNRPTMMEFAREIVRLKELA
jgi:serine/threonine protein kinase